MPTSSSRSTGFKSQIAKAAHKQWLDSEAKTILARAGKRLSDWNGSIYSSFLHSGEVNKRPEKDYGLIVQGTGGEPLPSLIIQSCWNKKYDQMFSEMERWMQWGEEMVQVVILLKWSLISVEKSKLKLEIEVYEYAPDSATSYRRASRETIRSDKPVKELPPVILTTKQLFGSQQPRGQAEASYRLSLNSLWATALEIFKREVGEYHKRRITTEYTGLDPSGLDTESDSGTASGTDSGRATPLGFVVDHPISTSPYPDIPSLSSSDSLVAGGEKDAADTVGETKSV